ncbi:TPA: hypothetical protein QCR36_004015 [Bacillus cereus]|nr:hypothetical protein [Bacillus cereus]HDR4742483.1 hypothetical protein [Bacillus cereus]HDR4748070.1 hypothetical protein [Bacillus cereus]HDR4753544.1 hypothetical protein [Bacillus cereus]HDR4770753.1 hypothetical protein [Bacillus cereus]
MDLNLKLEQDELLRIEDELKRNGQSSFEIDEITRGFIRVDYYIKPENLPIIDEPRHAAKFVASVLNKVMENRVGIDYEYAAFAITKPHIFVKTGMMTTVTVRRSVFPMDIIEDIYSYDFKTIRNKQYN